MGNDADHTHSFVSHAHVFGSGIRFRINGDSLDAHFFASFHDSACNFSTIGDQDFVEERLLIVREGVICKKGEGREGSMI